MQLQNKQMHTILFELERSVNSANKLASRQAWFDRPHNSSKMNYRKCMMKTKENLDVEPVYQFRKVVNKIIVV